MRPQWLPGLARLREPVPDAHIRRLLSRLLVHPKEEIVLFLPITTGQDRQTDAPRRA